MIKVKRGDIVESEFGRGKVVAITKEFLIHEDETGGEVSVFLQDYSVWVPADCSTPDVDEEQSVELPVE